jgi:hypothetical protein
LPNVIRLIDIWPHLIGQTNVWPNAIWQIDVWPYVIWQIDVWPIVIWQIDAWPIVRAPKPNKNLQILNHSLFFQIWLKKHLIFSSVEN